MVTFLRKAAAFVANQVGEVLEITTVDEWHYTQLTIGFWGLSSTALMNQLIGPDRLGKPDFPYNPSEEIRHKVNINKGADCTEIFKTKENQCHTLTANVTADVATFV